MIGTRAFNMRSLPIQFSRTDLQRARRQANPCAEGWRRYCGPEKTSSVFSARNRRSARSVRAPEESPFGVANQGADRSPGTAGVKSFLPRLRPQIVASMTWAGEQ